MPGSPAPSPRIVCDLPAPVCPYAKTHDVRPASAARTAGDTDVRKKFRLSVSSDATRRKPRYDLSRRATIFGTVKPSTCTVFTESESVGGVVSFRPYFEWRAAGAKSADGTSGGDEISSSSLVSPRFNSFSDRGRMRTWTLTREPLFFGFGIGIGWLFACCFLFVCSLIAN